MKAMKDKHVPKNGETVFHEGDERQICIKKQRNCPSVVHKTAPRI
jgi:hypothetical protein